MASDGDAPEGEGAGRMTAERGGGGHCSKGKDGFIFFFHPKTVSILFKIRVRMVRTSEA